jgi:hypothetical protein
MENHSFHLVLSSWRRVFRRDSTMASKCSPNFVIDQISARKHEEKSLESWQAIG